MNIEKSIEIYLNWKTTHTNSAYNRYEVRLKHFQNYIGKDKLLSELTGDDVINFHRHLEKSSYLFGCKERKYSLATIAYSARVLKNFIFFWQGRGQTSISAKEILPIKFVSPIKRVVSQEEFEQMSSSLSENNWSDLQKKLAIHLLWDTGMRISELKDLDLSKINNRHPEYGVRTAYVRTRKTMRYNVIVWSKRTDDLLNKYLGLRLCVNTACDALFISGRNGNERRTNVKTLTRWIKYVCALNGLPETISPHSFRHGKAHHILNTNGNVRDIHVLLRHVSPESSFHYLTLNQNQYIQTAIKYLAA